VNKIKRLLLDTLEEEMQKLAVFLVKNYQGRLGGGKSPVDCAIEIMNEDKIICPFTLCKWNDSNDDEFPGVCRKPGPVNLKVVNIDDRLELLDCEDFEGEEK